MDDFYNLLNSTGIPVTYGIPDTGTELPYMVYMAQGQNTVMADNKIYAKSNIYRIEYYFDVKSEANESTLENTLSGAGYTFTKSADTYIDSESLYAIYYEVN